MDSKTAFEMFKELAKSAYSFCDTHSGAEYFLSYEDADEDVPEHIHVTSGEWTRGEHVCDIYEYDEVSLSVTAFSELYISREKAYEDILGECGDGESPDPDSFEFEVYEKSQLLVSESPVLQRIAQLEET